METGPLDGGRMGSCRENMNICYTSTSEMRSATYLPSGFTSPSTATRPPLQSVVRIIVATEPDVQGMMLQRQVSDHTGAP